MTNETKELKIYEGAKLTFTCPTGRKITIREKNGDDDDILTPIVERKHPEDVINAINEYVMALVRHDSLTGKEYITLEDVLNMDLRDKYYILLKSRIHSDGNELKFEHTCRNSRCGHKDIYKEDLNIYDADLNPKKYQKSDFEYQIFPAPLGSKTEEELLLPSNLKVKYDMMTGKGEIKILDLVGDNPEKAKISKNLDYLARNLQVFHEGKWQPVYSFAIFGSKDMKVLRNSVDTNNAQWSMLSELECPKCGNKHLVALTNIEDFFFPVEV